MPVSVTILQARTTLLPPRQITAAWHVLAPLPCGIRTWRHSFCIPRQLYNELIKPAYPHDGKNSHRRNATAATLTAERCE